MPKFSSHIIQTTRQLAINEDTRSNAFRDRDCDQISVRFHTIEPHRGQRAGIRGILQHDLKTRGLRNGAANIEIVPPEVRSEYQAAGTKSAGAS